LEEKLGDVTGLAAVVTKEVEALLDEDSELHAAFGRQREEAEETERRCTEVAAEREGKKTGQCILYSALDAYVRHFEVLIPIDGVGAIYDDLGDAAIKMMGATWAPS
jgi:hypothetical protein